MALSRSRCGGLIKHGECMLVSMFKSRKILKAAQLSPKGRATLRVVENFAKSLKVIQMYTVE